MPELIATFNFEKVSLLIQQYLQKSVKLYYVPDESIIVTSIAEKDVVPTFKSYLIKISPTESSFENKIPMIGNHYKNIYIVAIELWLKSGAKLTDRLLSGKTEISKGVYEFYKDVSDILEHNNFDGQLNPYAGSNIQNPILLRSEDNNTEGIGFLWFGCQYNFK